MFRTFSWNVARDPFRRGQRHLLGTRALPVTVDFVAQSSSILTAFDDHDCCVFEMQEPTVHDRGGYERICPQRADPLEVLPFS